MPEEPIPERIFRQSMVGNCILHDKKMPEASTVMSLKMGHALSCSSRLPKLIASSTS